MDTITTEGAKQAVTATDLMPTALICGLTPSNPDEDYFADGPTRPPLDEDEKEESYQRWLARSRARSGLVYKSINGNGAEQEGDREEEPKSVGLPAELVGDVKIYNRDVVIKRKIGNAQSKGGGGNRGRITAFSRKSRQRMKFTARNVSGLRVMITLTYPSEYPTDGEVVKAHWERMRKWLIRQGVKGFWFLEFQRRGAPHLHVFLTGPVSYRGLAETWYRIVSSGDEKHLRAGTRTEWLRRPEAVAIYAQKYATKMEQKEVPEEFRNVGRFWGLFGGLECLPIAEECGALNQVGHLIRIFRRLEEEQRKKWGGRKRRDTGRGSRILYDIGGVKGAEAYVRIMGL